MDIIPGLITWHLRQPAELKRVPGPHGVIAADSYRNADDQPEPLAPYGSRARVALAPVTSEIVAGASPVDLAASSMVPAVPVV